MNNKTKEPITGKKDRVLQKRVDRMFSSIKRFIKRNKVLFALLMIAVSVTMSYYITYDMLKEMPDIERWVKLSSDLSIGIIINFIFYVFQVYIPRREEEQSTLLMIESDLVEICNNIQEILHVLHAHLPDFNTGKVQVTENPVYYLKMSATDSMKGWARYFDLYNDFKPLIKSIARTTDELLSSLLIQGCDKEIIELLGQLQRNGFLHALEIAEKDKYDPRCKYGDLEKCYPGFYSIYEKLRTFVRKSELLFFGPLTQKEISFFQDRISSMPPGKEGTIHIFIQRADDTVNKN